MIEKIRRSIDRFGYSLKTKMFVIILVGAIVAAGIYIGVRFTIREIVDISYNSAEAKREREGEYISSLQKYADDNAISSADTEEIEKWVRSNRYVYLVIYKDDELFFSDGVYGEAPGQLMPPFTGEGGITVDYPDKEELADYAEKRGLHPLTLSDGTLFASLADFSEYFYYDMANIISLAVAFVFLAFVMMMYFRDITNRISVLADDVNRVSEGDMQHSIKSEGTDEIAELSGNVEIMRNSILENLRKEREARDANAELITSMSHDIRTPLTVLLGYLDLMKMHTEDKEMQSYIRASEATAMRLKTLSDDMFGYFLVFGGTDAELELAEYDAGTLIEQLFSEHALLLSESGYILEDLRTPEGWETLTVRTDAPKTMRIVDNIFSNVTKYADKEKPITVEIRYEDKKLFVILENSILEGARAESNKIGLKTCDRLAQLCGIDFVSYRRGDIFGVKLGLPVVDKSEGDKEDA